MQAPRTRTRGRLSVFVSLVLAFTGLQAFLLASPVQAASGTVVISEIFGANGTAPNLYNQDYVELHNPTASPVSLAGMSVQYRSATSGTGASSGVNLSGSIPAGGYVLVGGAVTAGGTSIPTPDFSGTGMNMSGTAGVVILANATTSTLLTNAQIGTGPSITGTPGSNALIQDLVGYGATANRYETNFAPAPSTTSVIKRTATDADNNSTEFTVSNTGDPTNNSGPSPLTATNPGNKTYTQNVAITPFNMAATGGTSPYSWTDPGNSLPAGLTVNSAGQVSGTPTGTGTTSVTLLATDSALPTAATDDVTFDITVNAASALTATDPGPKTGTQNQAITNFTMAATGGTPGYTWSDVGSSLPTGVTISSGGLVSGIPTGTCTCSVTLRVTDSTTATDDVTFTFTVSAAGAITPIADIQGTGARAPLAPLSGTGDGTTDVTTEGVVTAVHKRGFTGGGLSGQTPVASNPTCGFCGFTIQTAGTGGTDLTPGKSDAIFVWGKSGFTGLNSEGGTISIGDSVRVTGKVAEFGSTNPAQDTNSLSQITYTAASAVVPVVPALSPVIPQTALPAVYADREAHESELFAPTDVVVTDTFNFETFGELGIATGNQILTQPTEICTDDDTTCITNAQTDIKNRGYFLEDGTNTSYLSSATFYRPHLSTNSDIPLPFMDATHSVRIGAKVTYPIGGVLEFRNRKWYLNPPREVLSTHNGGPVLGTDVVQFQDTRPADAAPANVGGDLKLATYNVENFFDTTGAAFAAANPYYDCDSDFDRLGQPIAVFECNAEDAIPNGWDPVTNAVTSYGPGLVNAPRGAWRQEDLDRQTSKIVTAINGLGADIVSLQELGNPNKLRMGVLQGPLDPPDNSKADLGLGTPIPWRDEAISYLVDALNDDAGAGTWAFVASPEESTDATAVAQMCATTLANGNPVPGPAATAGTCSWASGQDVIRSGFIYKRATVVPVGASDLDLPNSSAPVPSPFDNAREPLAQFFKPVGHPNSDGFAVIANHFKSKGDSDPVATGGNANSPLVGAFNLARTNQAKELLRFANEFADKWDTNKVFLVGDINSYSKEDPIQAILNDPLNTLGFTKLLSSDPSDTSYMFSHTIDEPGITGEPAYGARGSLDHVFASAGANAVVTGVDIWEINANESTAFNFGRYNTNKTLFLNENDPFAGSDHNPEIIGINAGGAPSVRDIQIIGSNDFHGRLVASSADGGAAQLAGAVKSLKDAYSAGETPGNPNSIFVAAGDLIGATTFESFIDKDKPTLKALNAAGLEISAIGNHEFDQGVDDLVNRVMKPYDLTTNPDGIPGGLDWDYIGANVEWTIDPDGAGPIDIGDPIVLPTATKDFGGGIEIGFVGAVTEDLPNLVAPSALAGVQVNPIAAAVNTQASQLVLDGADVVVLLVHEGAPSTNCATMDQGDSAFAELLGDLAPNIDAVISGHTHLEYSCSFPVPEWAGDPIEERPVLSAGQYGVALDQLVYSFDTTTGEPVDVTFNNVGVKGPGSTLFSYPEDPTVKQIVQDAVDFAGPAGAVVLGKIDGPFKRARLADGTTENRGGESTIGNLVAEIQRAQTPASTGVAQAQIAFMNPGGLRDDLVGSGGPPADVTYKQAAAVQPFANTLVNMDMTGAQIKAVLEQQWQRDPNGNVPSRPFLRLGTSKGFTYTYTEVTETSGPANGAKKGTVTSMWLNGTRITDAGVYSVTMNSFLAGGGDNFRAFLDGADKRDTGLTDLQAQVDYFAANATPANPLDVDFGQHAVRVTFPGGAPASYEAGDTVEFDLASLAMSGVGDTKDTSVKVRINGVEVATGIPVTNTLGSAPNDEAGTAAVSFTLPEGLPNGTAKVHIIGNNTGTDFIVPVEVTFVEPATRTIQILGTNDFHGRLANDAASGSAGAAVLAGAVKQLRNANPDTAFVAAGDLIGASTFASFIQKDKPTIDALNEAGLDVSAAGNHEFDAGADDLVNRVMAPYDPTSNPLGGAEWEYIAANVRKSSDDSHLIAPTWTQEFGSVKVGYVGAVTEELPTLVSPAGIAGLDITDIVDEVNDAAADLKADGADVIVMLVHEGAPGVSCATMDDDPASTFGNIIANISPDVDAIVSGHTHLEYDCEFPVAQWATEGRAVTDRPVVSAGQYGTALNKIEFVVDTATGDIQSNDHSVLKLKSCTNSVACTNYPADPDTAAIVTDAVADAEILGAVPLGQIGGPFMRGKTGDSADNRGAESTIGNLVGEVQRWATSSPTTGSAQIAFINPGGLRGDMLGSGTGSYPRTLTYQQAAEIQPFANTLVNMDMTGAQIKQALEQQWRNNVARPMLRLGTSKGFKYTYIPPADGAPLGTAGTITGMWLNGTPIELATTYSVTVNSFLAAGGDAFPAFAAGTGKQDTGVTDLQAMVDYMDEFANVSEGDSPLPVDYVQRSVGIKFPAAPPASYKPGDHVQFGVSSWSFSATEDAKDTAVTVKIGATTLGTATLDNTRQPALPGYDEVGKAAVDVVVPVTIPPGPATLTLEGATTGTTTTVPITIGVGAVVTAADKTITWGDATSIPVTVEGNSGAPTGTVDIKTGGVGGTTIASATVTAGVATVNLPAKSVPVGSPTLTAVYNGDATYVDDPYVDTFVLTVGKATPVVNAPDVSTPVGADGAVTVTVTSPADTVTGTVEIKNGPTTIGSGSLTAGSATITLDTDALAAGTYNLDANYLGDANFVTATDGFVLTVTKKAANLSVPNASMTYGKSVVVTATLDPAATGTVTFKNGAVVLGSAPASGGLAAVTIPAKSLVPGARALTAEYTGDAAFAAGTDSFTVNVAKAASTVKIKITPKKIKKNVTKAKVKITVSAVGVVPTGKVKVKVKGMKAITTDLGNLGKAVVKLKTFGSLGAKNVKVKYLGNTFVLPSSAKSKLTVTV